MPWHQARPLAAHFLPVRISAGCAVALPYLAAPLQDNAYLDPESWQCLQVTAWVPLLDATRLNGCLQVLRGGHASGTTAKHTCCVGGTW